MAFVVSTRVGSLCCLIFFICIGTICAQEGFVSIECCSSTPNIDPKTNISWISDESFLDIKRKCVTAYHPVSNKTSPTKARVFDIDSGSKWCYNLTTIKEQDYLLRGTFIHGLSIRHSPDTNFGTSVGTTLIAQVHSVGDTSVVEGAFKATDSYVNFCLVQRHGSPYLSNLELRPLHDSRYLVGDSSVILKLVRRIDAGNEQGTIRYPLDSNDRIWRTNVSTSENAAFAQLSNNISVKGATRTLVPLEVLQTALTDNHHLEFIESGLEASKKDYMIRLYFLELNSSIRTGERVFDIYINGIRVRQDFDILQNSSSNYREDLLNVKANGSLNISLTKVSADVLALGPICNAYEIFQVYNRTAGTAQEDVDAIAEVRDELLVANPDSTLLRGWSGDPCQPSPWQGLTCEYSKEDFVIVKLDLSSNDLQGSLPAVISRLTELQEINVRHNKFLGSIPESYMSLKKLTHLSFGCNPQVDKQLPPGLSNHSNLVTDFGYCDAQYSSRPKLQRRTMFVGSIAGGSVLFTVVIGVAFTCIYRHMRPKVKSQSVAQNAVFFIPSMDNPETKPIHIQIFSLQCVETATSKYKTMIGEGGFGAVYRGTLLHGQEVAVKVRSATSTQGTREFENELNLLSAIQHENLVPLLGYCCENDQQILVYPFMSNGSLQDRLYGEPAKRKPLDWQTRLSIALGAARGLLYLHNFAGRCVIHRDVKSSNILLDHSMCAKVADFGFSKYAPQEGDSGASLEVRGTAGYLDPEYYSTQKLSAKSDVFSFGVVLLEIVTGQEPLNIHRPRNEWSLVEWAKQFFREVRIEEMVDSAIKASYHAEAMWRVVEVAMACVEPFSTYRPCMDDIVRELEDAFIIENNASEYMKSIESIGGSNRFGSNHFNSIEKVIPATTPTPSEPSPLCLTPSMVPPLPR